MIDSICTLCYILSSVTRLKSQNEYKEDKDQNFPLKTTPKTPPTSHKTHTGTMSVLSTGIRYAFYLFLLSSYKSLPLVYYVRFSWVLFKNLTIHQHFPQIIANVFKTAVKSPFHIDVHKSYNSPFECDFYMHKSNSCYFEELDIVRASLMTSMFSKFFREYPTESKQYPFVPVANIFTSFKKEIKPFEKYTIKTRIVAWDDKWLFLLSKFILSEGSKKERTASTTVTKYVLKDGRKTIPPAEALKFEGLWNEEYELKAKENLKLVDYFINTDQVDEFNLEE